MWSPPHHTHNNIECDMAFDSSIVVSIQNDTKVLKMVIDGPIRLFYLFIVSPSRVALNNLPSSDVGLPLLVSI